MIGIGLGDRDRIENGFPNVFFVLFFFFCGAPRMRAARCAKQKERVFGKSVFNWVSVSQTDSNFLVSRFILFLSFIFSSIASDSSFLFFPHCPPFPRFHTSPPFHIFPRFRSFSLFPFIPLCSSLRKKKKSKKQRTKERERTREK